MTSNISVMDAPTTEKVKRHRRTAEEMAQQDPNSPQAQKRAGQMGLRSLTDDQLQEMIEQANTLPEAIRKIANAALEQEAKRRASSGTEAHARADRAAKNADLITQIKAIVLTAQANAQLDADKAKAIRVELTFNDQSELTLVDVHSLVGTRATGKTYTTTWNGQDYSAPTLKQLAAEVFPDSPTRNPMQYFTAKGAVINVQDKEGNVTRAN